MNNYVFLVTHSGDRTNIKSDIKLISKKDFFDYLKGNDKHVYGTFRYGKIGGHVKHIKDMRIEEFEDLMCSENVDKGSLDTKRVQSILRKEIDDKYGEGAKEKAMYFMGAKDIKPFHVYKVHNGERLIVYCGNVKKNFYNRKGKLIKSETGRLFLTVYQYDNLISDDKNYIDHGFTKNVKSEKLIECMTDIKLPSNQHLEKEMIGGSSYEKDIERKSGWYKIEYVFLDYYEGLSTNL